MGVSLQVFLWDFFPHIYDTFWRLHVLSGVVRLTCTRTCRVQDYCECVWKCVSYICFTPCLCSLLHPTRHPCLLFMGTGTAGHPSRAFSQRRKKTQSSGLDTHSHTQGGRERDTHTHSWLVLICFLLCCCVPAASGSNSRTGLPVQMH